jgi:hypothetical protein
MAEFTMERLPVRIEEGLKREVGRVKSCGWDFVRKPARRKVRFRVRIGSEGEAERRDAPTPTKSSVLASFLPLLSVSTSGTSHTYVLKSSLPPA